MRKAAAFLFFLATPLVHAQAIPTEFRNDRVFVIASAANGERVRFFTDTGGGWNALLRLPQEGTEIDDGRAPLVDAGALFDHAKIPAPIRDEPWLRGKLVVAPAGQLQEGDGTLGSRWFAGRIWEVAVRAMGIRPSRLADPRERGCAWRISHDRSTGGSDRRPRRRTGLVHAAS